MAALAEVYRRFGESVAATSPLYERVALALSGSEEALGAIAAAPSRRRNPTAILAALHDLALAGHAPELAAAYAARDGDAAASAAIDALRMTERRAAGHRTVRADETGRHTVLYPAVAEAARRMGASAVGLIDVGRPAGLNLNVDRVGIAYNNGQSSGDPASPVQRSASIVGGRPVPSGAVPEVVTRVVVDRDPVDVTDAEDARWLRACLRSRAGRGARSGDRAGGSSAAAGGRSRRDAARRVHPRACGRPAGRHHDVGAVALPLESRLRFLHRLDEAARRPVAWVSVEGVGVAPSVPTLGDRRASGHSIIGLAELDHSTLRVEAVGRCWSRGRLLAWLS